MTVKSEMTQGDSRGDVAVACSLLAIALLFGGGSALFPIYRLIVEVSAVIALAWFGLRGLDLPNGRSVRVAVVLLAATLLLLLAQLIPLPADVWRGLPGRELVSDAYLAIGEPLRSAPVSLDPSGTRDTIAFFLVPVAMFVAACQVGREGHRKMMMIVAAAGLLNGLLVVLQFQGFSSLTLFVTGSLPGVGLFANKNHSAAFLVTAMPAVAWVIMESRQGTHQATRRWVAVAAVTFLALTVFGCLSRAGLALMPLGIAASALIIAPPRLDRRRAALAIAGVIALGLLLVAGLPRTTVGARALGRFDAAEDLRYQFWPVVLDGVRAYFPVGSGFGTFREVFAAREPVTIVQPNFINHAHSDYVEIALEGGIIALALVAAFAIWFLASLVARLWKSRPGQVGFAPIAIAGAAVTEMLLHSTIDYPLRTLSLAAVTAVMCAMIALRPTKLDLQPAPRYRRRVSRAHESIRS